MKTKDVRTRLREELRLARRETDRLFEMLAPQAIYERPIPERHRILFYLGHLEAFDWNMICSTSYGLPSFHSQFDRLFAFGIDPVDGGLPQDQPSDWPAVDEVLSYSQRVRGTVDDILDRVEFEHPAQPYVENGQIFHVAIEHRWMHAETLAYMLHWLDYNLKRGGNHVNVQPRSKPRQIETSFVAIPAGEVQLAQDPFLFGWDNEFENSAINVPEFSMDTFNVTNAEFLDFVRSGGYEHRAYWTDSDWEWIQQAGIRHPKFWIARGDQWFYRTMFQEIPLPSDWPVFVSHAEASAYAQWKGKSLPTEAQFHRAAFGSQDAEEVASGGNFNFRSWTPEPVGVSTAQSSPFGVYDLVGNGWEWTSTRFAPFEGFKPFPFYAGYSADFFDGKHFVLKGASPRTAASLVRKSFRNWFQPHYPNIYATFRLVH